MRSGLALSLLLTAGALLRLTPARADGGFPDAQQILLPADRPRQIILGTNFGLIFSEDGGETWLFSCEHGLSAYAGPYRLAPLPSHRIFAITASAGLIYSDDDSCAWQAARGSVADVLPYGFSVDPSDGQHAYVIGAPRRDLRAGDSIFVSDDGGLSFGAPVFTAAPGSALLTVLAAPSQPSTVLVAMYSADKHPVLLRSHDWGQHWETSADLVDALGENPFELLGIDSVDPDRIYVRILGPSAETLGISKDGGNSFVQSVSISGKLRAFLKLASGTILVGGTAGIAAVGYRSTDDGRTFEPWPEAPRVHALAERNGKLYVAANNYDDGYAIADSDDEGATLRPLTGFAQVRAMKSCVAAVCAEACSYHAGIGLWPPTVCEGGEDAGLGVAGDGPPSPADAAGERPSVGSPGGGCGCDLGRGPLDPWTELLLLGSIWIAGWMTGRRVPSSSVRALRAGS
jgi:hypothetical protein